MNFTPSKSSLIITVFNEESTITDLISALKKQTILPGEVIIVDGGSVDKTYDMLLSESKEWLILKVFQVIGNRSIGRNYGVSKAHHSIIVFTDAGCILQKDWLFEILKPFSDSTTEVVSGYYKGLPLNDFQRALVPYVLVMPDRVNPKEFLPSTRSMALRKSIWEKSGGFDPKLSHNEDYAFAIWLKKMNIKFTFAPHAIVGWIPRKNLRQAAWMFTRFAIGDIQAGIIRPKVKLLFFRYGLFLYLVLLSFQIHVVALALLLLVIMYGIWSIVKNFRYVKKISALFWLPVLQITSDLCVIFGSLIGFLAKAHGLF
jgi:glycosyltransferase involved in cell wall biosynthesis